MKKNVATLSDSYPLRQSSTEQCKWESIKSGSQLSEFETQKLLLELELLHIKLEYQKQELLLAKEREEVAIEKHTYLHDFFPSAFISLSKESEIREINLFGANLLGYESLFLKDRLFISYLSDDTKPTFKLFLENVFSGKTNQSCEVVLLTNSNLPIQVSLNGVVMRNGDNCLLTMVDITDRKKVETFRDVSREVLQILNESGDFHNSIQRIIATIKIRTGFGAVGIRLQQGNDFPYIAQEGFSNDFIQAENTLTERTVDGEVCRDEDCRIRLECTCGLVISGKTDPTSPLFTRGGSFWINDSFPLLSLPSEQDSRINPRNKCIHQGYSSMTLVPIRSMDRIVGLIHLNDRRKGCSTLETIELLEGVASHIGEAMMRKQSEENLMQLNEQLEVRVKERTNELLKANAALRLTEDKFRTVADFTYDWEYWINAEGSYNYVSPSCERITGYSVEEFESDLQLIDKIIWSADKEIWSNHKKEVNSGMPGELKLESTFRILTKTGNIRWIDHICRRIYSDGKYLGIRVSNRDITERINAENELLNVTIEVEERERNRFSHELHDGLGPLLSTVKLYFQWLAETDDPEKVKFITEKGNNNIELAIQTTHEVALGLSSAILNNSGYVETVQNFAQCINDTNKLSIDFTFNTNERFSYLLEITLYRITIELINNTVKYANATLVKIDFEYSKEKKMIVLNYIDNGIGFDFAHIEKTNKRLGLMNIQQRIKNIRGILTIESNIGRGMKVNIELPVNETTDDLQPLN